MHRTVIIAAAMFCFLITSQAEAQRTWGMRDTPKDNATVRAGDQGPLVRPGTKPPENLPVQRSKKFSSLAGDPLSEVGASSDSLTESEILHRISRIYRYQSDILSAQADQNNEQTERLLELAMTELNTLMQQPSINELPRFPELYRAVVGEYERYYGVEADTVGAQYGDVFQLRADMFAALNEIEQPLLENVMLPDLAPMNTVIPMTMNRLVENSISFLLRDPDRHLYRWLSRAETYFPMIEQIMKEESAPDELKYLAMIESGLNPYAQSWAQAVGMWQFIAGTGRMYGLEVNTWVDERRDPEKATRAAARHLKDLYNTFGDWQLALAAYNCGAGNVTKALRRAGKGNNATFWEIWEYLPKETRGYVPMFIAAALVASNPDAFNLREVSPGPKYTYHYVPVQGSLRLSTLADLAGTDEETIRALNPELRRSTIPPASKTPYYLRIPYGSYDRFADGFKNLPDDDKKVGVQEHVVGKGETLTKIARQYGITTAELKSVNNLKNQRVRKGQRLIIPVPTFDQASPLPQIADAQVVTVQYADRVMRPISASSPIDSALRSRNNRTTDTPVVNASDTGSEPEARSLKEIAPPPPAEKSAASTTRVVYKVRRGDSLGKIASRYGVTIADIKQWNKLRRNTIHAGQRLRIYSSGGGGNSVEETASSSSSSSSRSDRVVYKVRRGDSLGSIAGKYGVSVSNLKKWNKLRGNSIMAGQRLTIHTKSTGSGSGSVERSRGKTVTYKVRRGDSLDEIARKHGVTISDIKEWNNLRSNTIRTGQRLKIRS